MVKIDRSQPAPASLAIESHKKNGRYNCDDVIKQLLRDFHDKCYICEMKPVTDVRVEHLLPHKNGLYRNRKFDWNNLFLSCPHCNEVKNKKKYDAGIIDCCREDPEQLMVFLLEEDIVKVQVRDREDPKVQRTADLIEEVFHSTNTGSLTHDSEVRLNGLQCSMNVLFGRLEEYRRNPDNKLTLRTLKGLLGRESEYAAFKRSYIKMHKDDYPEIAAKII